MISSLATIKGVRKIIVKLRYERDRTTIIKKPIPRIQINYKKRMEKKIEEQRIIYFKQSLVFGKSGIKNKEILCSVSNEKKTFELLLLFS